MKYLPLFLCLFCTAAHANDMDDADIEALQKTQQMLVNPQMRQEFIQQNKAAQNADQKARLVTGGDPQDLEKLYGLSSDIFGNITKGAGGNAEQMDAALGGLTRNPGSLEPQLTDAQRQQIKEMAEKLQRTQGLGTAAPAGNGPIDLQ